MPEPALGTHVISPRAHGPDTCPHPSIPLVDCAARRRRDACPASQAGGRKSMSVEPQVPAGTVASNQITLDELQLATRNHGMPLEAMRHEITPVGLHYLLIHYDIPAVDAQEWRLEIGGQVSRPLTLTLDE